MPRPLQVLIAEDNPADTELLLRELRRAGFEPEWHRVDTEAEYLSRLHPDLDIILSDFDMPQFGGPRALKLLQERGLDIPFIIISGTIGEDIAVDVMKQGATDYLLKDRLARLGQAISHAMEQARFRKERKQTVEALRQSEAEFRAMTEASPLGILVADCDGLATYTNATLRQMLGTGFQEIAGNGWARALHPLDRVEFVAKWKEAIARKQRFEGSTRFVRPDGKTIQTTIKTAVMREHDRVLGYVGVVEDITERKKLEEQLLRAQRMESIGTLASGIAHDLNNILSPIMMSVPMLRRELSAEDREGIISTIEMSAARGAQIVKQVLTFGRGLEGEKTPLQVGMLIKEMVKIMQSTFPKNITVQSAIDPDLRIIIGDATQLHQVLLNLCVNARDAMPEGGKLRLRARNLDIDASDAGMPPESTPGPHVVLEVGDDGSGIPPETLERIFEPFFTTKGVGQGTGLGLSTVHGIVRSHGGFINVASEPGKGTTFKVCLPAAPDQDATPATDTLTPPPAGHGELVLVVDDEPAIAGAARTVLESHGYRVLLAADGTEALATFAQNADSIAVVLTDLMMPHMGGSDLIRALRKMKPGIPVIASTGLGENARLTEVNAMGVETVLNKPYHADALRRAIHKALHPMADEPNIP